MDIPIYIISTIVLVFGLYRTYQLGWYRTLIMFVLLGIMVNGLDVFVEGDQTTIRQFFYLLKAVSVIVTGKQELLC
jgi:hypothetical protein